MARKQQRQAEKRREDRERRVDALRDRRDRAEEEADELPRPCARCGTETHPQDLVLDGTGGEVCLECVTSEDLDTSTSRVLWTLAAASLGVSLLAPAVTAFAMVYVSGELNASLTALAVALIGLATAFSTVRRAASLARTQDVLPLSEGLVLGARLTGWLGLAVCTLAALAVPIGWAVLYAIALQSPGL